MMMQQHPELMMSAWQDRGGPPSWHGYGLGPPPCLGSFLQASSAAGQLAGDEIELTPPLPSFSSRLFRPTRANGSEVLEPAPMPPPMPRHVTRPSSKLPPLVANAKPANAGGGRVRLRSMTLWESPLLRARVVDRQGERRGMLVKF